MKKEKLVINIGYTTSETVELECVVLTKTLVGENVGYTIAYANNKLIELEYCRHEENDSIEYRFCECIAEYVILPEADELLKN